jgi:hypothetical protein
MHSLANNVRENVRTVKPGCSFCDLFKHYPDEMAINPFKVSLSNIPDVFVYHQLVIIETAPTGSVL